MNEVSPELEDFINDFVSRNKIKKLSLEPINLETNLESDLNIADIDIDLFLNEFVDEFKVDYSKFDWKTYGYPKGALLIYLLKLIFGKNAQWINRIADKLNYSSFKVKNLQSAIETGTLI